MSELNVIHQGDYTMRHYKKPSITAVELRSCRTLCYSYPDGVDVMGQGEDNAPAGVREHIDNPNLWDEEW